MSDRFMATVTGRSLGDHVCWPFHGPDDLAASARQYVGEGFARHELVSYWRLAPSGWQHTVVSGFGDLGRPPGTSGPVISPLTTEPGWTPAMSPIGPLARMTEAAVAGGYAGLRVLTDATELARDPDARRQWVHSESLIDRYTLTHPLAIACGYDVDDLGEESVADVASVHALTGGMASSFLLHATDGAGRLALAGEVDRGSAMRLYEAVLTIAPDLSGPLVIDLSDEVFLDHTALVALHRAARALGTTVTLTGASPLTALLVDAFTLTGVTVEGAP